MKSIILILVILGVAATYGQIYRSSYAPAGSMYPRPQSAYEEEEAIADRTKGDDASNVPLEDVNLRNQVQSWPKEKQPFWYLNAQAINRQIGKMNNAGASAPTTADSTIPTATSSQVKPQTN